MTHATTTRRRFLIRLGAGLAPLVAMALPTRPLRALRRNGHPDPRPGIDGSRVLPADAVAAHVADLFDGIRAMAPVVDGIRCHCGCAEVEGMYSLLSCYEGMGMAQYCDICSGEGRLAVRLHAEGRSLDEIRTAIDRRFG
jgi:hypothetical protein